MTRTSGSSAANVCTNWFLSIASLNCIKINLSHIITRAPAIHRGGKLSYRCAVCILEDVMRYQRLYFRVRVLFPAVTSIEENVLASKRSNVQRYTTSHLPLCTHSAAARPLILPLDTYNPFDSYLTVHCTRHPDGLIYNLRRNEECMPVCSSSRGWRSAIRFHSNFGTTGRKERVLVGLLLYHSPMSINRRLEDNTQQPASDSSASSEYSNGPNVVVVGTILEDLSPS
jgi:hypothetical protein